MASRFYLYFYNTSSGIHLWKKQLSSYFSPLSHKTIWYLQYWHIHKVEIRLRFVVLSRENLKYWNSPIHTTRPPPCPPRVLRFTLIGVNWCISTPFALPSFLHYLSVLLVCGLHRIVFSNHRSSWCNTGQGDLTSFLHHDVLSTIPPTQVHETQTETI